MLPEMLDKTLTTPAPTVYSPASFQACREREGHGLTKSPVGAGLARHSAVLEVVELDLGGIQVGQVAKEVVACKRTAQREECTPESPSYPSHSWSRGYL